MMIEMLFQIQTKEKNDSTSDLKNTKKSITKKKITTKKGTQKKKTISKKTTSAKKNKSVDRIVYGNEKSRW